MKSNIFRSTLGGFIAGSFVGALAALYVVPIPPDNQDLIVFMLGQLSGFMGAVMGYNFGTTKSSSDKNEAIAALASAKDGESL